MKTRLARRKANYALSATILLARQRQLADDAVAGDVVGIPNHGTLRIGDTLTEGEDIVFRGAEFCTRNTAPCPA